MDFILCISPDRQARPLTVEEAKPKNRGRGSSALETRELMSQKAAGLVHQLREETKSGQPLEAAIQKNGSKSGKDHTLFASR